jgi:polyhydroxyalkanoate synthesis regulator phasin
MKKKMIALAGSLVVVAILVTSVGGVAVAAPGNGDGEGENCCQEEMECRFQWRAVDFFGEVLDYLGITPEEVREARGECAGRQELLEELGLTEEDVREAVEAVIEEKVADGTLTQEQADRMMEWLDREAPLGIGNLGMSMANLGMRMGRFAIPEHLCDLLGLTPEELREELLDGKTLDEIMEEQGVDWEEIHEAMLAGLTEMLEEKVADGTLTQEQADRILDWVEERQGWAEGRMAFGPGPLMSGPGFGLGRSMGPGALERWQEHAGDEASPGMWRPGKGAGQMNGCG